MRTAKDWRKARQAAKANRESSGDEEELRESEEEDEEKEEPTPVETETPARLGRRKPLKSTSPAPMPKAPRLDGPPTTTSPSLSAQRWKVVSSKPLCPYWIVEGAQTVFIWLLRIPTCSGSITCNGREISISWTIARPPVELLRQRMVSDDHVFATTHHQVGTITISVAEGELQTNRSLWEEERTELYAFAGIPKLGSQADDPFDF